MPFKTPSFWYRDQNTPAGWLEKLLSPLSALYAIGYAIDQSTNTETKSDIPVICIGNILAGGSGKTPTALALFDLVREKDIAKTPFFLTRGYGGSEKGPLLVKDTHDAKRTGDEPLLLQRKGPVIVSQDRPAGAALAQESGADIILMDDGFQNKSLHKDLSFLVIDGQAGLGNEKFLPAGPLREPLPEALARSDAVILIGPDHHDLLARIPSNTPIFHAHIAAKFSGNENASYIGFAGLGRPEKFKKTLQNLGLRVNSFHEFGDHHPYTPEEIDTLLREAAQNNAALITTEKDHVRLPEEYKNQIQTLPITLEWGNEQAIVSFLKERLKQKP